MTVIAWDGKTLAADRRACLGNLYRTIHKLHRLSDCLCASAGGVGRSARVDRVVRGRARPRGVPAIAARQGQLGGPACGVAGWVPVAL